MFYYISGKLAKLDAAFAVVDAGGVGFKMTISKSTYYRISTKSGENVKLYTYMAVREDGTELFGFSTEEELSAFKMLITVSGVGPKAAVSILSTLTPEKLAKAKEDLIILHPLPRVNEISVAIDKDPRACYFKQVYYGKIARMSLILKLLEVRV